MQTSRTQIGEISYNAGTQSFEALVTFHTAEGRLRVPATFMSPLADDHETVAEALLQNALIKCQDPKALTARLQSQREMLSRRSERARPHAQRWFDALIGREAA